MSLCSVVVKLASIGMGIPVVATEHNAYEKPKNDSFTYYEKLYKFYFTKVFNIVTVLTEVDKRLLGSKRKNVVTMPNPLTFSSTETLLRNNVIVEAGRVDNWYDKGFYVLIRAWTRVVSGSESLVSSVGWK